MEKSSELAAVLQSIYTAISDGDGDALTGCISAREGLVFIGTDPDEWFQDAATIKQMLRAQASAGVKVQAGSIVAFEEGTVGWVADRGAFVMADGTQVPFRITAVFHRENGAWMLVQEHASIAISNEEALGVAL
jgi:ketosteroid isomerase-like protein